MNIWVVNPFDPLPSETDVPLRYWTLCRMLSRQGHSVIWWSSDFSHLTKKMRVPCPNTDGFEIRLIQTPAYKKNISLTRIRNHRVFAKQFYSNAMQGIESGELSQPNRIIVSLPPLGVTGEAFKIRDHINLFPNNPNLKCQVIVDIMDAWPESFYRLIPEAIRSTLAPIIFAPLHSNARQAYYNADKISAVGQSYLELAKKYLTKKKRPEITSKPMFLCYHGTDLARFPQNSEFKTRNSKLIPPLKAVYLGAMGSGYDLETIIKVAGRWKAENQFPWQLHFAGTGSLEKSLIAKSETLIADKRVIFHGYINKTAITKLLVSSDLALVPNRVDSLVACPYKAAEYAAAGLPILSCLGGELNNLLNVWNAGCEYKEGDSASMHAAFEKYSNNLVLLKEQSLNSQKMAEALFNREKSYQALFEFILTPSLQVSPSIVEYSALD